MTDLHLCTVEPPGVPLPTATADAVAQCLQGLQRLGRRVTAAPNRLRHDAVNLVFGAAQVADARVWDRACALALDAAQLDAACAALDAAGPADPAKPRPIDLLVPGPVDARQDTLLQALQAQGLAIVVVPAQATPAARDALARSARAVLLADGDTPLPWPFAAACLSLGTPVLCALATPDALPAAFDGCVGALPAGDAAAVAAALQAPGFADTARQHIERFRRARTGDGWAAVAQQADAAWAACDGLPAEDTLLDFAPVAEAPRLRDAREHTPRGPAPLFQYLDDAAAQAARCIDAGQPDEAMRTIANAVHGHYTQPSVRHHALYYPAFDALLQRLAQRIPAEGAAPAASADAAEVTLIVATEVYQIGGHTRVIEDIAREVRMPVIVLTDLFGNYQAQEAKLQWIRQKFDGMHVVCLPPGSLWEKARMLRRIANQLDAPNIVYLQHHQDPIPFVATLTHTRSRKSFVHHGDHNPSLGCTLDGLQHADLSGHLQQTCSAHLGHPAALLPMHVADRGARRAPAAGATQALSVATCGHPAKYSRGGEAALHRIAEAVLHGVDGRLYHIGPLEADWVGEIRAHLAAGGLDPARFVHVGPVASLWDTLRELDVAFYLGSAPVGGGRAAIEAQGAGLPVVFFGGEDRGELVRNFSLYAHPELAWTTPSELSALLRAQAPRHAVLGAEARAYYERSFSARPFRQALAGLLGDTALRA